MDEFDVSLEDAAVSGGDWTGGVGELTTTVRVAVPVFPAASVALYIIVCVPAAEVSS